MILAKNSPLLAKTTTTLRTTPRPVLRGNRMGTLQPAAPAATHMEITLRLPAAKGLEFMKFVRDAGRTESSPILLWAGPQGEVDITVRDQVGSTDKAAKTLLTARAEYRLPKTEPAMPTERESMVAGELTINPGRHEVLYKGAAVPQLTYTEFGILHFLAKHAGWVFTREQIVEGVKGRDYPVTDRAVDVQVAGLRKKLGAAADHVQTVRGVGYRFKD